MPLGILIEVAGRKIQKDFEPILERQVHRFINGAMGVMHIGQRDMPWIRVSKEAFDAGFRLRTSGVILHAKYLEEYPAIVDKVAVTHLLRGGRRSSRILDEAPRRLGRARRPGGGHDRRDGRHLLLLHAVPVATRPNHVCVITPERLGLCGAYNWLDGKVSNEINPTGPQPADREGRAASIPCSGKCEGHQRVRLPHVQQDRRAGQPLLDASRRR